MNLDKIAEWLDWLSIDSSPATVAGYRWELRNVERWAAPRDVLLLEKSDLARYLSERRLRCSETTVRRSVNALRAFYAFALGKRSPARSLPIPAAKKRKQRTLTFEQAFALLASLDTSSATGKRNLALICLGLDSGLRESELCRLSVSQVDLRSFRLTVRVKGGNDADGVFGQDTVAALSSWLAIRPLFAAPGVETVFVSIGGDRPGQPLTPSGLRCICRKIGIRAGVPFSPHDLRRSFATMSHQLGAPTRIVQVAGRWSDVSQVERYTSALEASSITPYSPVSHILRLEP